MATPYQKQKAKVGKYNPKNVMFTDFSEGLYLLDTPRDISEQLGSLALKGGRNIFAEKGALVPQYGYYPLTQFGDIPAEEKIIAITKDDKSSSTFFIVTNFGNVYLYTAYQGLKKYKTTLDDSVDNLLVARANNTMIIYDGNGGYLFGDCYEEADSTVIDYSCETQNFGTFIKASVPIESKTFYWNGKKIFIPSSYESHEEDGVKITTSTGVYTVTDMSKDQNYIFKPFKYADIPLNNQAYISGYINLSTKTPKIELGDDSYIECVPFKHIGEKTQTTEKEVLKYECYNYTAIAPNTFIQSGVPVMGKVYFTPGSSVARYRNGSEMKVKNRVVSTDVIVGTVEAGTRFLKTSNGNGIIPQSGSLAFLLSANITRDTSGDVYETKTVEEVVPGDEYYTYRVNFHIKQSTGDFIDIQNTGDELNQGFYEWIMIRGIGTNNVSINLRKPGAASSTYVGYVDDMNIFNTDLETPLGVKVASRDAENYINRFLSDVTELTLIPDPDCKSEIATMVDLCEKTYLPVDFIYTPEEEPDKQEVLTPTLLEVCMNRLCIVNYDGFIYYTGVGITNAKGELKLNESEGAGYFGGFFNDNSKTLALDDYMTGILISKQNGLYYLTIADTFSSQSVSADSQSGINIKKIAEIGQQYKTDHLIVKEQVYAYDSNSDSIVLAATSNMFGSVVSGKVLIDAEFLNAQNFGIASSKRCLTFNKDAQVFILYYGDDLKHGILLNTTGNLFPRELDRSMLTFQGFNQGVIGVTTNNIIVQDYHKNTIIPDIVPVADFEAIGLKDSRCICASIAEVTELNGIEYDFLTTNTLTSFQHIKPYTNFGIDKLEIPPMIYSDNLRTYNSYGVLPEEEDIPPIDLAKIKGLNKWADKKSNSTRIYAPMSGRAGINICIQFPANVAFCLAGIRLNDFSQGD